jgi:hypothetical protein
MIAAGGGPLPAGFAKGGKDKRSTKPLTKPPCIRGNLTAGRSTTRIPATGAPRGSRTPGFVWAAALPSGTPLRAGLQQHPSQLARR